MIQNSTIPVLGDAGRILLSRARIYREFRVDRRAYLSTSSWLPRKRQGSAQMQRDLTFWYHQVEKGLSLPEPRRPFGAAAESNLNSILNVDQINEVDPVVVRAATDAFEAQRGWNERGEVDAVVSPPTPVVTPLPDARNFFGSRSSCRNYDTSRAVSVQEVQEVAALAQTAPSVCNRQAARVHYLSDEADIRAALELQSGNRGFGQTIRHLAIVTADRRAFNEASERNQGWIDGGLFAMTFVWALHARGLASCMLNWSMGVTATDKLREAVNIPEYEDVICMVAFGHPKSSARRARSERLDLTTVLTEH